MDAEGYQRLKELFAEASGLAGAERGAYVAAIEDEELRGEVERLLGAAGVDTGALVGVPGPARIPERVGPYRIRREIGRGGMGVVYAATDEQDRPVALKLIHGPVAAMPRFLDRFVREARAGLLVRHKNVVRTLAADADGDMNFIVMELVEGGTLRALLERLGTVPEALLREIARQTAAGLAAIHGAGIVHRDLKPENILITDDERVRIMDLGIAKVADSTLQLTGEGQFIGSLLYASPEQSSQEDVTPASDLYSLGVLLYELATGANPFRRDNPAATLKAHAELRPPPASKANREMTAFFSEVLATLMAKQPGDRFASALGLIDVLAEGEEGAWWGARVGELRRKHLPRVRVPRATAMVGRAAELAELVRLWDQAKRGRGSVAVIQGEAGLGKTRLVDALLHTVEPESHVLYGAFPPSGGMTGLTGAIENKFGGADLEAGLAPYLALRPEIVAAFASFVRGTEGDSLASDAMLAVTGELMRGLAAQRPTLWVMDDLHFAPTRARAAALSLARIAARHRVLLVVTARPGLPGDEIAEFTRHEHVHLLDLQRLSREDVVDMLREAFSSEGVAGRLGSRIARKSDGVPLFILEVVHGLKDGDALRKEPDGSYVQVGDVDAIEVPSAVREMIAVRLAELDRDAHVLLEVGAVQGAEFDAEKVAAVLQRPLVRVLQDLAFVERGHGIVRAAGRRYRFDHHQIHEVMVADLALRLKEEYHALLAEAGDPAEDPYFVAYHHLHGSRPREGLPHLTAALDRLRKNFMSEAALVLVEKARPHLDGKELVDTLVVHADILEILGRRAEQKEMAEAAVAEAEKTGDDAQKSLAYRSLGTYHWITGDAEAGLRAHRTCLAFAKAARHDEREMAAYGNIGIVLGRLGRNEEALDAYERSITLAQRAGNRKVLAQGLANRALVHIQIGEAQKAVDENERIVGLFSELSESRARSHWEGTVGLALWHLGRYDEAYERHQKQLEMSLEIGDRRGETIARGNLGLVYMQRGELAKALDSHLSQIEVCEEIGVPRGACVANHNVAEIQLVCGRLDTVEGFLAPASVFSESIQWSRLLGHIALLRGELERYRGNGTDARRLMVEAHELLASVEDASGVAFALLALGRLAMKDDKDEALRRLDAAVEDAAASNTVRAEVVGTACRAALLMKDADRALEMFARNESRLGVDERVEVRYRLWQATGDDAHLAEARALLDFLRARAPADARESIMEAVPLHRAVVSGSR